MNRAVLTLTLLDGKSSVRMDDVTSIVAADASGQFGLLPGHLGLVTVLEPGLFRYRRAQHCAWTFGACVGGLLICAKAAGQAAQVRIVSRRFLQGEEPEALQTQLDELLERESVLRLSTRESREQLDLALYRRMQQLSETQP